MIIIAKAASDTKLDEAIRQASRGWIASRSGDASR